MCCKLLKCQSHSSLSTCLGRSETNEPAENKRETIKKCKLQTEILFQMKNYTEWMWYIVVLFLGLKYLLLAIIPFRDNNFTVESICQTIHPNKLAFEDDGF